MNSTAREVRVLQEGWDIGIHSGDDFKEIDFIAFIQTILAEFRDLDYLLYNDPAMLHSISVDSEFWQFILVRDDFDSEVRVILNIRIFEHIESIKFWDCVRNNSDPFESTASVVVDGKKLDSFYKGLCYIRSKIGQVDKDYEKWRKYGAKRNVS